MRKLATKPERWAIVFLWTCFSVIGFFTIYGEPLDPGGWLRLPMAFGLGALGLIFAFVILGAFEIVTGWLPRKLAYLRLSPLERYAVRINSWTARGRRERAALEARLQEVAESMALRQTIYRGPENGQHWLGIYQETGHSSHEQLTPLDRQQLEDTLRRFKMFDDGQVPTAQT